MYCAIRNFDSYNFSGDTSTIKEYIMPYKGDLLEVLEETKDTDINYVYDLDGYDVTDELIADLKNLVAARDNIRFTTKNPYFKIEGIPFFYSFGALNAENLDMLKVLCEKGVSDAYVSGELAFNMKNAKQLADRFGVKLRLVPNVAQVSGFTFSHIQEDGNLTAFWVRPEDLDLYEPYVDVIEFVCDDIKQEVFHEIYFQESKWSGTIDTIVVGVNGVNNRGLISLFTEARLNCGKKCLMDKCHNCHRLNAASKLIVENNLEVEESI